MFKYLLSIVFFILITTNVKSETVNNIIVKSNIRVSKATIINFTEINLGDNVDETILNNVLKKLYNTNFFSKVDIKIINNELIISVTENKIIQSIEINGVKAKKFKEVIFDKISLKEKSPYIEYLASNDITLIKEALLSMGFYFANVTSFITENENNTVNIIFDIEMGDKASVGSIKFTGNKVFKSGKLRNIITSEEDKFWKFISSKRFLNEQQLKLDERLLKRFYLNNGYYDVEITSVFAKLLDSGKFKLVFNIDAGNIYTINKTNLILPADYKVSNFDIISKNLQEIKNTKYSFIKINKIIKEIDKISLLKEYEFINATFDETIVDLNLLDLTIKISETKKKYVERINIFGNNITQENVIRDQLTIDEGDAYNDLLQTKSLNNLKSINIFKSVTAISKEGSTPQQTIIDVTVEEKPTGEISLGAGIGSAGGSIGFSIVENNYMGKAIKLQSSLRVSDETIQGQFSIVNPNFNYSEKSLFTNIQSMATDRLDTNGYKSSKTGFSFGTSYEHYEDIYFSPSINSYYEKITTNAAATSSLKKQEGNTFDTSFGYSLDYDKRNQKFMPSEGFRSMFTQSVPIISENYSLSNAYVISGYNKLENDMVTQLTFFSKMITALAQNKDVQISQRLSLPSNKLRGFERGRVGPVDNGDYVGGNYMSSINFSTTLPMIFPSLENTDVSYFIDVGNVWGVDYSDTVDESNTIRSSSGVVVNWFTPIGPLNFSYALPITKVSSDKTQAFQFNLGTNF